MNRRFPKILAVLGFGLVGLFLWLSLSKGEISPILTVRFLGYTNDSSNTNLALFKISNEGQSRVLRWDIYQIELQSPSSLLPADGLSEQSNLRPGASETVALMVPFHQGSWRAVFVCSNGSSRNRLQLLAARLRALLRGNSGASIEMHFFRSGWIDS